MDKKDSKRRIGGKYALGASGAVVALVVFVVAAAAWFLLLKPVSAADVRDGVVEAVEGVKTYRVATDVVVHTTGRGPAGGRLDIENRIHGEGKTDIASQRMVMDIQLNTSGTAVTGVNTQTMKMYLIGDRLVMYSDGTRTEQQIANSQRVWERRIQLRQEAAIIKGAKVSFLQEDSIGGRSYYVLDVKPDLDELVKYILEQSAPSGAPPAPTKAQIDEMKALITDVSIRQWVDEETLLPHRFLIDITLDMEGLTRTTRIRMETWDYNQPMDIRDTEMNA